MHVLTYFTTLGIMAGTILAVFAMRYYARLQAAKAATGQGDAYRVIAERAAAAEAASAEALVAIQKDMADVRARLAGVEKILRDVG